MGGGGINSLPAGFFSVKFFCFPVRIGRKFPAQKRTSPRRPFVGKLPQSGEAGAVFGGDPLLGNKRTGPGHRPGRVPVSPLGRGWGKPGPAGAPPAAGPTRLPVVPPRGSRGEGRGCSAPHIFKGESVFSSPPTPHQRRRRRRKRKI